MSKTGKRPIRALSAHEKLDAIKRVHDGESKASVARDIGVPESTLRGWCKNETKISYQSRQSSPETDESSFEPKEKRAKLEQPFNLSLKTTAPTYPTEALYTPLDYSKADMDAAPKTPQNLSIKNETPKSTAAQMTEREKTRAELARLSVELGLNRPEMFGSSAATGTANLTDLASNITLLSQWNSLMMQQQQLPKKQEAATPKLPKEQQSVEEYIKCWLKAQEALITNRNGVAAASPQASTANNNNGLAGGAYQSSWFWKWYKQLTYNQQASLATLPAQQAQAPVLYQQLTKDGGDNLLVENKVAGTASSTTANNKARSVLDNLLCINNNQVGGGGGNAPKVDDGENLSPSEALEHGEKFMKWLQTCSDPSVTAMQIMQFKALLNNIKNGTERRINGDLHQQNKAKVKRK